jgi:hypothetical protein
LLNHETPIYPDRIIFISNLCTSVAPFKSGGEKILRLSRRADPWIAFAALAMRRETMDENRRSRCPICCDLDLLRQRRGVRAGQVGRDLKSVAKSALHRHALFIDPQPRRRSGVALRSAASGFCPGVVRVVRVALAPAARYTTAPRVGRLARLHAASSLAFRFRAILPAAARPAMRAIRRRDLLARCHGAGPACAQRSCW